MLITKEDLAKYLVHEMEGKFTVKTANKMIDILKDKIAKEVAEGNEVRIKGFGNLRYITVERRVARNLQTGAKIIVPKTKRVRFKAYLKLAQSVNK